jgi:succinoglycan biosynthesis protein ExoM
MCTENGTELANNSPAVTCKTDLRSFQGDVRAPKAENFMKIDICICTFRRPSLERTMRSLDAQIVPEGTALRIIVADNDEAPTARDLVMRVAEELAVPVTYVHAPSRNISIARNASLDAATGDLVAFIDDDEFALPNWIGALLEKMAEGDYDAVFGPVNAEYPAKTPAWMLHADHHSTFASYRNGVVQTGHCGNTMIRRMASPFKGERFLLEKGKTGGEDTEFFFRAWRAGATMAIAESAKVFEPVEHARLKLSWIMKRKFRSGITYGRLVRADMSAGKAVLSLMSTLAKIVFSGTMAFVFLLATGKRNSWLLRALFHAGMFASVFSVKEQTLYG